MARMKGKQDHRGDMTGEILVPALRGLTVTEGRLCKMDAFPPLKGR